MTVVTDFLKTIGGSGLPQTVDPSLEATWKVYHTSETPENELTRMLDVLGFYHLVRQAGLKRHLRGNSDPASLYQDIISEQFGVEAKELARKVVSYRIFDVLRAYKSKFNILMPIRGTTRTLRFDMCLVPKRNEHLDNVLRKLHGLLYTGDLPIQLQEKWKKLPITSNAKPRSSLPKYTAIVGNDSILGWLPLHVGKNSSIYAKRAADDMLILRFMTKTEAKPVTWMSDRKHNELLKSLFTKSFSKLKG